jgi:16S rRNA (guanine1516-N2)-methyltransferase
MLSARSRPNIVTVVPGAARVAVLADTPATAERAQALAQALGLPLAARAGDDRYDLLIACTLERLELRDNQDPRVGPVAPDFGSLLPRPGRPTLTRRDPLARAFGREVMTIADTTAGLAHDSFRLACAGYRVTAIERHPVIAALVRDALARAEADDVLRQALGGRLTLRDGDARAALATLEPKPDAVYLDPMFPPKRRRSAAVRKELRLLRLLAGEDADAHELLAAARTAALKRVIVKRPDDAPPLAPNPAVSYGGKLVRYDVYLT